MPVRLVLRALSPKTSVGSMITASDEAAFVESADEIEEVFGHGKAEADQRRQMSPSSGHVDPVAHPREELPMGQARALITSSDDRRRSLFRRCFSLARERSA